jgi:hypothetical protein
MFYILHARYKKELQTKKEAYASFLVLVWCSYTMIDI